MYIFYNVEVMCECNVYDAPFSQVLLLRDMFTMYYVHQSLHVLYGLFCPLWFPTHTISLVKIVMNKPVQDMTSGIYTN